MKPTQNQPAPTVQRQIALPLKKAVEIAYKNIRMRLSRSLLVTSGIVLALAFLMSIRVNESVIQGMRQWIDNWRRSPEYAKLDKERQSLDVQIKPIDAELRTIATDVKNKSSALGAKFDQLKSEQSAADKQAQSIAKSIEKLKEDKAPAAQIDDAKTKLADATAKAKAAKEKIDKPRKDLGKDMTTIQKDVGTALPGAGDALLSAMAVDDQVLAKFRTWIELQTKLRDVGKGLSADKELIARMEATGVPTEAGAVANAKVQTRWMLSLALLVAFVGILNAMLMSVTERFREIGTMKCLGALDSFIVKLFLIESLFQGVIGTILGLIIGLVLTFAASAMSYGSYAFLNVPWGNIFASAGLVFLVGVALTVGGAVYPAWQAARMAPVEAMRVDT